MTAWSWTTCWVNSGTSGTPYAESLWKGEVFLPAAGDVRGLPQMHRRVFAEVVCGPRSPLGREYLFFLNTPWTYWKRLSRYCLFVPRSALLLVDGSTLYSRGLLVHCVAKASLELAPILLSQLLKCQDYSNATMPGSQLLFFSFDFHITGRVVILKYKQEPQHFSLSHPRKNLLLDMK